MSRSGWPRRALPRGRTTNGFRPGRRTWPVGLAAALVLLGLHLLIDHGLLVLPETLTGRAGIETRFTLCASGRGTDCVVDGDTLRIEGAPIRIADIDAPETRGFHCAQEAALGARAADRLLELVNQGPFDLARAGSRDEDRYGRKLRTLLRDGQSLGMILVAEGLARPWDGARRGWC